MTDAEKLTIAVQALKDIYDPVGHLHRLATIERRPIDPGIAVRQMSNPGHYSEVAEVALTEIGEITRQPLVY